MLYVVALNGINCRLHLRSPCFKVCLTLDCRTGVYWLPCQQDALASTYQKWSLHSLAYKLCTLSTPDLPNQASCRCSAPAVGIGELACLLTREGIGGWQQIAADVGEQWLVRLSHCGVRLRVTKSIRVSRLRVESSFAIKLVREEDNSRWFCFCCMAEEVLGFVAMSEHLDQECFSSGG